jgi:hypothetical protein
MRTMMNMEIVAASYSGRMGEKRRTWVSKGCHRILLKYLIEEN